MNSEQNRGHDSAVGDVRQSSRCKYPSGEKSRIVLEGLKGKVSMAEQYLSEGIVGNLCRRILPLILMLPLILGGGCDDSSTTSSSDDDELRIVLLYPENYSTIHTSYETLKWYCAGSVGSTEFRVRWRYWESSTLYEQFDTVYDVSEYTVHDLLPGKDYSWNIFARDSVTWGDSEYRHFRTADEFWPVGTIYSPTPDDGAVNVNTDVELSWRCNNPETETFHYDVYFGISSTPPLVSTHQGDTSYSLGSLDLGETYYWRVVSYNESEEAVEGPLWQFTTVDGIPGTVFDPNPSDGATGISVETDLSWSTHTAGVLYDFDVYFDTVPDPARVTRGQTMWEFTPPHWLEAGQTYYWKIVTYPHSSPTDSSIGPVWSFKTASPTLGVYARIEFESHVYDDMFGTDEIRLRFDSSYAPVEPINPLAADSVTVNDNIMDYSSYSGLYVYAEDPSLRWLVNGASYSIGIYGNDKVPTLGYYTDFLECSPMITEPENMAVVPTDGFIVRWSPICSGEVRLVFVASGDTTDVSVTINNDGRHDFTGDDVAPLVGGARYYDLVLINEVIAPLEAGGYDSRSTVTKKSSHSVAVYIP